MFELSRTIESVLERRRTRLPFVDAEIERWQRLGALLAKLREMYLPSGGPPVSESDISEMARLAADSLAALQRARTRVTRETVNIGVSGQARNGKSTLLQSISGLDDQQIPTGRGRPVTAVRSRIFHSPDFRTARLTVHTEQSFMDEVLRPHYDEFGVVSVPGTVAEFAARADMFIDDVRAKELASDPTLGPLFARLREIHDSVATWRPFLTGATLDVPLADLRAWVAYPLETQNPDRRYLAVREAVIHCGFPDTEAVALGLIDLPGLGEMTPKAEERHLAGLHNDVDFVLVVKWPTDNNALWTSADAAALNLINTARGAAAMRDFVMIVVNTGECAPGNVAALREELVARLNNKTADAYYRVLEADVADAESVRLDIMKVVLEHLADALPRMDTAIIDGAIAVCERNQVALTERVRDLLATLRKLATPTSYETMVSRAREMQADLADALQDWITDLQFQTARDQAEDGFLNRASEVQGEVRSWILSGFGEGPEHWQELAVQDFRRRKASRPFAADSLNGVRVEMARLFAAVEDVLLARRNAFWAGLVTALGPRLGALGSDAATPQAALEQVVAALREVPEPCPNLVQAFEFVLDIRLDFRTLVLPYLRKVFLLLYPEPEGDAGVRMASLLGVSHDEQGAALLYERIGQLARQGVHDAGRVLATVPDKVSQVLLAFAEQFEDIVIRGKDADREMVRVVDAFRDQMWPDADTGNALASVRTQRMRAVLAEINQTVTESRKAVA